MVWYYQYKSSKGVIIVFKQAIFVKDVTVVAEHGLPIIKYSIAVCSSVSNFFARK